MIFYIFEMDSFNQFKLSFNDENNLNKLMLVIDKIKIFKISTIL